MRNILLIILFSALAWSTLLGSAQGEVEPVPVSPGVGLWNGHAMIDGCADGEVCAQWEEPGGALHGTFCCISQHSLWSNSFDACLRPYYDERPPDDDEGVPNFL